MKEKGWDTVILSDPNHEHLVAELHFDGSYLALLDREHGRDSLCIGFPDAEGIIKTRMRLDDFLGALKKAADGLRA